MSPCLVSLLTVYLRSGCLGRRQNPAFWRRRTQRGVSRERNRAAWVKSLRDCPKQVRPCWQLAPNRHPGHNLQPHSGGCPKARFRRSIESGPTPDRRQREESRENKRRWFCLQERTCEGTEVDSLPDLSVQNSLRATHYPLPKFTCLAFHSEADGEFCPTKFV